MRDFTLALGPPGFGTWLKRDLKAKYGAVLGEDLPDEMLALLREPAPQS